MTSPGNALAESTPTTSNTMSTVSTTTVLTTELRKLAAQKRSWIGIGAAVIGPIAFAVAMSLQSTSLPKDTPFGRYARDTGLAGPLVLLGFGGLWFLPMLTAIVAGDIFSSEDHHGTWKTLLTRSVSRRQVYVAKAIAAGLYATTLVVLMTIASIVACGVRFGFHPLVALSGEEIGPGRGVALIAASWALTLLPLLAFTAIALACSLISRNGITGVVAPIMISFLMQLLGFLNAGGSIGRHFLLTTQFEAFHGFFHDPSYSTMIVRAVWVSLLYAIPPIVISYRIFSRRDVVGG
jgi:ABC-2 type transport system permease protein